MTQLATDAPPAPPAAGAHLLRALGLPRFCLLLAGQTVSRLGDFVYQIALAWWVLQKTGSPAAMGTLMVVAFAPMLLFLLIGGVAVDRFDRVKVMLASDVLRALLVLVVAALEISARLHVWHLYAVTFAFGFIDAFFDPAYAAAIPDFVPDRLLASANSLTSLSRQLGRIAGPPLGAGVIAWAGTGTAFALNAVSFLISALCLLPLISHRHPRLPAPSPDPPPSGPLDELRIGIRFVTTRSWLCLTIPLFALTNVLLAGPYSVCLPFLVNSRPHSSVALLGFLYAMFAVGYAIAAFVVGSAPQPRRRGPLIFAGIAVAGAALALFAFPIPTPALALAAILNGFALELAGLAWTNALQQNVPPNMLGRVSSIDALGSFALLPLGYALAAYATPLIGPPTVFLLGGAATATLALLGLLHPAIRRLH